MILFGFTLPPVDAMGGLKMRPCLLGVATTTPVVAGRFRYWLRASPPDEESGKRPVEARASSPPFSHAG
jgi:hypothetical protein